MAGILGMLCLVMLFSAKIHWKGLDKNYLAKDHTQAIKGIFIIIVFLSHIRTYAAYTNEGDMITIRVLNYLGQLMVAMFLFYSGYGIYEAIKKKGNSYIDTLLTKRFGRTYFDFAFAIVLFLIVNACQGVYYPMSRIIKSFLAWEGVGNSAWYMFAVFSLYILSFICFSIFKNLKYGRLLSLCLLSACSLGYVYVFSIIKENYWSSTYLCFIAGMWYSFFKKWIDQVLQKYTILYYVVTPAVLVLYNYFYVIRAKRLMIFNLTAILFCMVFVCVSMKISHKSKILNWFGDHLFWIYILQRIPMMVLQRVGFSTRHPYIFLYVCFGVTIVMSCCVNIVAGKLKKLCRL